MSPNLLAVSSSPRRGGNSETLLKAFLEGASKKGWQGETVRLNELSLKPCQDCDGCAKDGRCVIKDDMQLLYPKVLAARGLVLATPIYFGSVSAQLKIFIDRFQCWWQAKYPLQSPLSREGEAVRLPDLFRRPAPKNTVTMPCSLPGPSSTS